jgi:hypothetical protein
LTRLDRCTGQWTTNPTAPGERYAYSDTVHPARRDRRADQRCPSQTVRALLDFDRLTLDETYSLEPAPPAWGAHQYIGDLDGYDLDPSFKLAWRHGWCPPSMTLAPSTGRS